MRRKKLCEPSSSNPGSGVSTPGSLTLSATLPEKSSSFKGIASGFTDPSGQKKPSASTRWPFGTSPSLSSDPGAPETSKPSFQKTQDLAQAVATSIKKGRRKPNKVELQKYPEATF